jgi:hypothetical protein
MRPGALLPQCGPRRKSRRRRPGFPHLSVPRGEATAAISGKEKRWTCAFWSYWRFDAPECRLIFTPTGKQEEREVMIQHSRASMFKASLFIAGGLAFFLVLMHQAAQFFR